MITRVFLYDHLRDVLAPNVKSNAVVKHCQLWATREGVLMLFRWSVESSRIYGVVMDVDSNVYTNACRDMYGECYADITTPITFNFHPDKTKWTTIGTIAHTPLINAHFTQKLPFKDYAELNGEHNYTIEAPIL